MTEHMTRASARNLILDTIREYNDAVMVPLRKNKNRLHREVHANAISLLEHSGPGFSAAVQNWGKLSDEIMGLNNFQMSQLLSLCRDISILNDLPVRNRMPESIPEDSPVRYVAPNETDFNTQRLTELNDRIKNDLESLKAEADRTYRVFAGIVNFMSSTDITGIFTQVENAGRLAAESFQWLGWLLHLFPNENDRRTIFEYIEAVQGFFRSVDMASARREIENNIFLNHINAPAGRAANAAAGMSMVAGRRRETITEDDIELLEGAGDEWVEERRQSLSAWLEARGWSASIWPPWSPHLEWSGDTSNFRIDGFPIRITYSHSALNGDKITLFFNWDPFDDDFSGGANMGFTFDREEGVTELGLGYRIDKTTNNGFSLTLHSNSRIALNSFANMEVDASVTLGGNPGFSAGIDMVLDEGSVSGGGRASASADGAHSFGLSAFARITDRLSVNVDFRMGVDSDRNETTKARVLFNIRY